MHCVHNKYHQLYGKIIRKSKDIEDNVNLILVQKLALLISYGDNTFSYAPMKNMSLILAYHYNMIDETMVMFLTIIQLCTTTRDINSKIGQCYCTH